MKNSTQGFTLIELLIVIAIIGILAAVLIPNLLGAQKRAYDTGAQSCAKSIQTAQATWQIDKQTYAAVAAAAGSTTELAKTTDGIAANCAEPNMSVVQASAPNGTTFNIEVGDIRGSKTFVVTPSSLAPKVTGTGATAATAGAPATANPLK